MLAHLRLGRVAALGVVAVLSSLASAQIHGVAPSVTSFGFGGSSNPTPGVAASVTSVGPQGFACCSGPYISPYFVPSQGFRFDGARSHGRRSHDHLKFPVGIFTPAYVPYAVPYPVTFDDGETGGEYGVEADAVHGLSDRLTNDSSAWRRDAADLRQKPAKAAGREAPVTSENTRLAPASENLMPENPTPIAAQPATVLVYKDGRKNEVQNYAIVGDTLFDFSGNLSHKILLADLDLTATQKANEDRGVEFQVPARPGQ